MDSETMYPDFLNITDPWSCVGEELLTFESSSDPLESCPNSSPIPVSDPCDSSAPCSSPDSSSLLFADSLNINNYFNYSQPIVSDYLLYFPQTSCVPVSVPPISTQPSGIQYTSTEPTKKVAINNNRKRPHSVLEEESPVDGKKLEANVRITAASTVPVVRSNNNYSFNIGKQDEAEMKRQKRLIKNRESAQKSRLKKKQETSELQQQNQELENEKSRLKTVNGAIMQEWRSITSLVEKTPNVPPEIVQAIEKSNKRIYSLHATPPPCSFSNRTRSSRSGSNNGMKSELLFSVLVFALFSFGFINLHSPSPQGLADTDLWNSYGENTRASVSNLNSNTDINELGVKQEEREDSSAKSPLSGWMGLDWKNYRTWMTHSMVTHGSTYTIGRLQILLGVDKYRQLLAYLMK